MILKNLWRRKIRSLLTALGIAVGVAAVVALSSFGEGIAGGFERMFSSSGADLQVAEQDAAMLLISSVDDEIGQELAGLRGVDEVAGTVVGLIQMPEAPYFVVLGEDPRGFAIQHYRVVSGQPLTGRRQILLGKTTAKNFKKAVGQTFRINDVGYRVVGIYETGVGMEEGGAVLSLEDAQRAFDRRNQVSYFNLKVADTRQIDEVKQAIEARWPDLIATRSGEPTQQAEALNLYRSFGWFLGIFAVLVGGLGMMNATLMGVFERTREIGMLRAIGWRGRRIVGLIVGEALVLALAGGLLGIGLGLALITLMQFIPAVESLLQGVVRPAMLIQALVVALLLGAVGSLYPAWRAVQLAPVEAMRADGGAGLHWGRGMQALARLFAGSALRNLWRRPTRTLVTVVGIGLGVGFVVALISVTAGFTVMFAQLAGGGQGDLLAEQAKASDMSFSTIDERLGYRIAGRPGVSSVSRLVFGTASMPDLPYFIVFGLDPREAYAAHYRIREGRVIERTREVMLGRFAANGLEKGVGDSVHLGGVSYRVVGIYENGSALEDASGVMILKDAQRLLHKPRQVSLLVIEVADPARAELVAQQLEAEFPELLVARAATFSERIQDMATTYAILNALIGLTLVVGGIVMMNTMLMSVFERTQEIGVLRALGWRRLRVLRMVLIESLAVSGLSAAIGMLIGVGLNALIRREPSLGQFLAPVYTPGLFLQVGLLALTLGALGGLYPAWRAAGLRPIEALRYE